MLTPETLLRMDAKEAIFTMAQAVLDTYHPGLNARWYRATVPTVIEGTLTEVIFVLDKVKTPVQYWDVLVSFPVRYHRLDINDIAPDNTSVVGLSPTTTHYLLQDVLGRYDIPLSEDELVIDNVVLPGPVDVTLNPEGYRWIGDVSLLYDNARLDLSALIKRDSVVTNFSEDYSSLAIRDDIVDHLNRANANRLPKLLNKGDMRFCVPVTVGADAAAFNTKIKLVATGLDYSGSDYIYYKRRHFQETWRNPLEFTFDGWTTTSAMAGVLSERLGCVITPADIATDIITLPSTTPTLDMLVRFNPESLGYVGWVRVILNDVPTEFDLDFIRVTSTGVIRRDVDGVPRRYIPEAMGNNARIDTTGEVRKTTDGRIRRYIFEESDEFVRYATTGIARRDVGGMLRHYNEKPVVTNLRVDSDNRPRRDTLGRYRAFVIGEYSETVRLTTYGVIRRDVWGDKRHSVNYAFARRSTDALIRRLTDYSLRTFRQE